MPSAPPAAVGTDAVAQTVDHLFRREAGRLVATLTRHFGVAHLHLAEDVVQDALVRAMQIWPYTGVPEHPSAWLLQTAKNRALDHLRRARLWRDRQATLVPLVEDGLHGALAVPPPRFEDEIRDSQLCMMFVCCHPGLAPEAQVALTLKTLGGFGEPEIAAAFLCTEAAIAKRLVRARQYLREHRVGFELPAAAQLAPRVAVVRQVLYLLFNEGYKASQGDALLRADLCADAIRLAGLLAAHPAGRQPATLALLALMHFNTARLPARVDDTGSLLLLAEQDRTRWDRREIEHGLDCLAPSAEGAEVSRYHLEAGIAACHCLAPSYAATDWRRILELYDQLVALDRSPVAALNRAVAVARVHGPRAGLRALDETAGTAALEQYHLRHAVAGQLWLDAGEPVRAAGCFRQALELAALPAEREFLARRLAEADGP